ncbi:glutamate--ammonia ligase [Starmerella bacillaris]|uniref:Glutamine synthetase n=1 Tax=Starmerella bacillaris TaxID=1247836 RepID=A0AAV5RHR1_STABA|nr:glutamate--ammonia ligase [Starmerella bacillaris]
MEALVPGSQTSSLLRYLDLPTNGAVIAEYVWIDGNLGIRSKAKTLCYKGEIEEVTLKDLPIWNFDGSSTGQAPGDNSDILLKPVSIYKDPFRRGKHVIVLAECLNNDGTPNKYNFRHDCELIFEKHKDEVTWFGIEQEYTLLDQFNHIYGWPKGGFPEPQGPYYCGVGTGKVNCRDIVDAHYFACLYAGINISGVNAEVMPSQWEFQVGPCVGIEMGDQLTIARYFLHRIAEDFGVKVTFHPKPLKGDWNGAGCHTNVSTASMRAEGGLKVIEAALEKLGARHAQHIEAYGEDNHERLTGRHETASMEKFSYGVANRGASVRIPRSVALENKGYFEDRRPASNIDPYVVTGLIGESILGFVDGVDMYKKYVDSKKE